MSRRKYLRRDQILAVLRDIEEDMFEYNDSGSESDANESVPESDASYESELDFVDNTNIGELEKDISGNVNSRLDSLHCIRIPPRIEEAQVEARVPPQEIYTAAVSTDISEAEQESSSNAELAPGTLQTRVPFRSVVVT